MRTIRSTSSRWIAPAILLAMLIGLGGCIDEGYGGGGGDYWWDSGAYYDHDHFVHHDFHNDHHDFHAFHHDDFHRPVHVDSARGHESMGGHFSHGAPGGGPHPGGGGGHAPSGGGHAGGGGGGGHH